jgi:crossover junction endodeoxyribonuclease RusA
MKLTLPVPPSANRYWRTVQGRVYVSTEARRYRVDVHLRALTEGMRKPLTGPVVVSATIYRERKTGDLDNRLKVLLDALKGVAFIDDDQVVEIHARREDDRANPRAEVRIEATK